MEPIMPDGFCGWHCLLAVQDFKSYRARPRNEAGFPLNKRLLKEEQQAAKNLHAEICRMALSKLDSSCHGAIQRVQLDAQFCPSDLRWISECTGMSIRCTCCREAAMFSKLFWGVDWLMNDYVYIYMLYLYIYYPSHGVYIYTVHGYTRSCICVCMHSCTECQCLIHPCRLVCLTDVLSKFAMAVVKAKNPRRTFTFIFCWMRTASPHAATTSCLFLRQRRGRIALSFPTQHHENNWTITFFNVTL